MRSLGIALPLLFALGTASCVSSHKRVEQGQELEQQGRPADAARRYIDALRRDRGNTEARTRLNEIGTRAIQEFLAQADADEATGRSTDAAERFITADGLIREALAVGVPLPLPAGYAEHRAATMSRAVNQALTQATGAMDRGDFASAVQGLTGAQRWSPSTQQQTALTRALHDAQVRWAQADMTARRYRSAYGHAEAALAMPGFATTAMRALQADALRRGTARVAPTPVAVRAGLDSRMAAALNESLVLDQWPVPPEWVTPVNTDSVLREVRSRGLTGREIGVSDAAAIANDLGVRFAIAVTIDSVRYAETAGAPQRRTVRTRRGVDTAYTVEEGTLEMWTRATWTVVDVANGNRVDHGTAEDRARTSYERARYNGAWTDLVLTSSERALFEGNDARGNTEMFEALARSLAPKVAQAAYEQVLRRIE